MSHTNRLILVLLVALLVAYSFRGRFHTGSPVPHAQVEWTTRDFGTVTAGAPLSATCTIHNSGQRRLIVHAAGQSCGCVRAGADPIMVPPRSSSDIPVQIDTKDLEGPLQLTVRYTTSDPRLPQFLLTVRANVRPSVAANR